MTISDGLASQYVCVCMFRSAKIAQFSCKKKWVFFQTWMPMRMKHPTMQTRPGSSASLPDAWSGDWYQRVMKRWLSWTMASPGTVIWTQTLSSATAASLRALSPRTPSWRNMAWRLCTPCFLSGAWCWWKHATGHGTGWLAVGAYVSVSRTQIKARPERAF